MKILFKENIIPDGVDRPIYHLAPVLVIVPALVVGCVIPFGPVVEIAGRKIALSVTDLDLGLIFVFAVASLTVYGIVLAGWASDNKWSLLGALRSSAQMVSYEITLALSAVGVLLLSGTLNLRAIADQQAGGFWNWYVIQQPLGFALFLIAGIAETNRAPFDLPEAESELTGGYHTEYSSMRFAMFYMAEYINVFIMSAIAATLFLGGFHPPYPCKFGGGRLDGLMGFGWILAKVAVLFFILVWTRGTLPRLRYDQLMSLGWKILLPLAFINLFLTAVLIGLKLPAWQTKLLALIVGLAILIITDFILIQIRRRRRRAIC